MQGVERKSPAQGRAFLQNLLGFIVLAPVNAAWGAVTYRESKRMNINSVSSHFSRVFP